MTQFRGGANPISAVRQEAQTLFAAVTGEIDLNNSTHLRDALFALIDKHRPSRLVLDLSGVPYMDSSAIAALVELLRKLGRQPGSVCLTHLQPRVKSIIEIARLHTLFTIAASEKDLPA